MKKLDIVNSQFVLQKGFGSLSDHEWEFSDQLLIAQREEVKEEMKERRSAQHCQVRLRQ